MQISDEFALATHEPDAELRRRMYETAFSYGYADVVVFQDAPRVGRNLAANAVIPLMNSFIDVRPHATALRPWMTVETFAMSKPQLLPACLLARQEQYVVFGW